MALFDSRRDGLSLSAALLFASAVIAAAPAVPAGAAEDQAALFVGLVPARLADTRPTAATSPGGLAGIGAVPAGSITEVQVTGLGGVPASGVGAVALNVTVSDTADFGYVTVYPCGEDRPTASNLNYTPGQTVPNAVISKLGTGGTICVYTFAATHLIVDVNGWFPMPANSFEAIVVGPAIRTPSEHRIAIVVCPERPFDGEGSSLLAPRFDAPALTEWAQLNVAPWFEEMSTGLYRQSFEPHPLAGELFAYGTWDECERATEQASRPRGVDTVIVADGVMWGLGAGAAGPGFGTVFGGMPHTWVHELGHTLGWGHSYTYKSEQGKKELLCVYCDRIEVMGGGVGGDYYGYGGAYFGGDSPEPFCKWDLQKPDGEVIDRSNFCWAEGTSAFNRLLAGWIATEQIAVHADGTQTYTIESVGSAGVQVVLVPASDRPGTFLTLEARPLAGRDRFNIVEGVAAYRIDQGGEVKHRFFGRCQEAAVGSSDEFGPMAGREHVLATGSVTTIGGVKVEVLSNDDLTYRVRVTGSYSPADKPICLDVAHPF